MYFIGLRGRGGEGEQFMKIYKAVDIDTALDAALIALKNPGAVLPLHPPPVTR